MKIPLLTFIVAFLYHINEASIQSNSVINHLGSRTPYRFIANKNDSRITFPGCKEKKIWMMIRHGTRLPCSKDILSMKLTLPELKFDILLQHKLGKGKLSKDQLEKLEAWSSNLDVEKEKSLALEGQDEMILLAERMQKRFPGAIKTKYDNETFLFRYTATERAQQSARYFANGLFERDAKDVIFAPATKVDLVLRFYKHCDKWQKQVKKNPETYAETELFGASPEMNRTLQHVSRLLGFNTTLSLAPSSDPRYQAQSIGLVKTNHMSPNLRGLLVATEEFHYPPPGSIIRSAPRYQIIVLSSELHKHTKFNFDTTLRNKVRLMYKVCGFETAWNKYFKSPWCAPFDEKSAQVLEYYFDLKQYWADGYGHELTYRQACMAIKNMFDNFSSEKALRSTFFFSHSGTLLKIISHLGLYKPDSHLRAGNYEEHRNRSWRPTNIDCFATNIAFVLYQCKDGDHMLTLHQERPVRMPMCESELCPLKVLTEHYHESIHNCNYSDMCSLDRKL